MSKTIDQKVVEMKFDNKDFEKNVQISLASLNKLEQNLNLEGSVKNIQNLSNSAKNFNLDGMGKAVDAVQVKFSALQVIATTALANITNTAINTARSMVNAVTSQIKQGGYTRALNIENAKFQLKGLGVAWSDISDDIDYGVKDTAYGLDAAAKAASQLVASGVQIGDSMKAALRGISAVAAMTNSDYESISSIFTTVAGQGRLMTMQLRQMESRGLNAAANLAKTFSQVNKGQVQVSEGVRKSIKALTGGLDITESDIREFVTKGKIDFAMFSEAMDAAFGEHAKEANETYSGALSNMKAALSRIGALFAAPYLENARHVFLNLKYLFDNFKKAITPWSEDIETAMKVVRRAIDRVIQGISKDIPKEFAAPRIIKDLANLWHEADAEARTSSNYQMLLSESTGTRISHIFEHALGILVNVMETIYSFGVNVKHALKNAFGDTILATIEKVSHKIEKFFHALAFDEAVNSGVESFLTGVFSIANVAFKIFNQVFDALTPIKTIVGSIGDLLAHIANTIGTVLSDLTGGNGFLGITGTLTGALKSLLEIIAKVFDTFVKAVIENDFLTGILEGLVGSIKYIVDTIGSFIKGNKALIGTIKDFVSGIFDAINAVVKFISENNILGGAFEFVVKAIGAVIAGIQTLFNTIKDWGPIASITKKIPEIFGTLKNGLGTKFNNLIDSFNKFIERAKEVFSKGFSLEAFRGIFNDFITNVLPGIGEFIREGFSELKTTISDSLSSDFEAILSFFKGVKERLGEILDGLGIKFKNFGEFFKNKFGNIDFHKILVAGFGTTMLIFAVKMGKTVKGLIGVPKKITEILENVGGAVSEFFNKTAKRAVNAKAFEEIAKSILMIAGALFLISKIDKDRLGDSLLALGGIVLAIAILAKVFSKVDLASLGKLSSMFLSLGASLVIIALAMKIMSKLEPEGFLRGILTMITVVGLFYAMCLLMQNSPVKETNVGVNILAMAASVYIVALALKKISKIADEGLAKALGAVGLVFGAFIGLILAMGAVNIRGTDAGLNLLAASASVLLLAYALQKLGSMPWGVAEKGILDAALIFGMYWLFLLAVSKFDSRGTKEAGLNILAMAASLLIVSFTIEKFSKLSKSQIKKGVACIAAFMGLFIVYLALLKIMKIEEVTKASIGLLAVAASVGVLAFVAMLLSSIDTRGLTKGIIAVAALSAICAGLMYASKFVTSNTKSIWALLGLLAALVISVAILASLDTKSLFVGIGAVALIGLIMAGLMASTRLLKNGAGKSDLLMLLEIAGIVVLITAALAILANQPIEGIKAAGIALSLAVSAFSVAVLACAAVGKIGAAGAIQGLGAMLLVIGAFGALTAALGGLNELTKGEALHFLQEGIPILSSIGEALGSLVGGFISGIAGGVEEGLKKIATGLGAFMQGMFPFIMGAKMIDSTVVEGVGYLAAAIAIICGGTFLTTITEFLTLGKGFNTFGEKVMELGEIFKDFAESMSELDVRSIRKANLAAEALASLAKAAADIPNEGGVVGFFAGENGISQFAEGLAKAGPSLKKFADETSGITKESLQGPVDALMNIIGAAAQIPNEGGVISKLIGDNTIGRFAEEIASAGPDLKKFYTETNGIEPGKCDGAINVLTSLIDSASKIPNEGGGIAKLIGDNTIQQFASELASAGPDLGSFARSAGAIPKGAAKGAADIISVMSNMAAEIPNEGGALGWLLGDNALSAFAAEINNAGADLVGFVKKCYSIVTGPAETVASIVVTLSNASTTLTPASGENFKKFASALSEGGEAIALFCTSINNVGLGSIIEANNSMMILNESLANAAQTSIGATAFKNAINELASTAIQDFVTCITSAGPVAAKGISNMFTSMTESVDAGTRVLNTVFSILIKNISSSLSSNTSVFKAVGLKMATQMASGIRNGSWNVRSAASSLSSSAASGANGNYSGFYSAGAYMAEGLANGIRDNGSLSSSAAYKIGEDAVRALRRALNEKSPSKESYEAGYFFDLGLVNGILSLKNKVENSATMIGDRAVDGLKTAMEKISTIPDDWQPTITPVLDLSNVNEEMGTLSNMFGTRSAMSISASRMAADNQLQNGDLSSSNGSPVYNFTQNNYSPTALSRIDIYRQTKNQFSQLKEVINA